ncbi:4Fe-4S dicluster domain-containing protein [Pelotomaculum propionicicum]|uniref:Electron transport complex subunit RsxB n=1 Tax=Pelotomaculum propionicicum TaxID=258475 RepID=A0A4Y7RKJ6_9FIRM|nr:4Fe-4S dicluster domain-containing protein [Pelotomaculum propionicicum]NLI12458.1 4Fe-4S dicluster domain-containing protein [Peptococcaceae bacterium]TEB09504.1 Electron transport complex subunit RsxB [Pelotomaculum propionicicum]
MGHLHDAKEAVYRALAERLSKNPVGVKVNKTLMEILHRLYTESEALVGGSFPLAPVTIDKIATGSGIEENSLKNILEGMAEKGLVIDLPRRDKVLYILAPMVIGFFEYTFMRVRDDINMKELAELFERYFQNDEARAELSGGATKMFKALVYEKIVPAVVETEVLSYERASDIIRSSGGGALSMCSCRHKASHLNKACGAPLDVCTTLGKNGAEWLVRRELGKPATVDELLRVLEQTEKAGLVHLGDNVLNKPTFICHCCGCCCTVLHSIRESGKLMAHPSNFIPRLAKEDCSGCAACSAACQIRAITMRGEAGGTELPLIKEDICLGCSVCACACPTGALTMSRRRDLHQPPQNSTEKFARIAMEKGRVIKHDA